MFHLCHALIIENSLDPFQVVQNAATRLLPSKYSHVTKFRIHFKNLVLTFRALRGHAPAYISELLHPQTIPQVM